MNQGQKLEAAQSKVVALEQEKLAWTVSALQSTQLGRESNKKELEFIQASHARYAVPSNIVHHHLAALLCAILVVSTTACV